MSKNQTPLRGQWLTMREDRYRPDFIPSEHPSLPPEYYDACVVEEFYRAFLSGFSKHRQPAGAHWPLEWFVAVELEKNIYGTNRSLMHLIDTDEEGQPTPTEHDMRLLTAAYRSDIYGVANLYDVPDDWDEAKPWAAEPGNGLLLIDNWTYPMVEMLLGMAPGRGKTAMQPQIGYQLWVGYQDGGTIEVAGLTDDGTYSSDAQQSVPAVDVVMALFGPQETKARASKYAPPTPPAPGRYDLYDVQIVQLAASDLSAEITAAQSAMASIEAEARQFIGASLVANRSDSALWIADKEEGRARRIQQKNRAPVTFGDMKKYGATRS